MIFPSTNSCKNNCGFNNIDKEKDCSCSVNCLREGNCCDDFQKECSLELGKLNKSKYKLNRKGKMPTL